MRDPDATPRLTSRFRMFSEGAAEYADRFGAVAQHYSRSLEHLDRERSTFARRLQMACEALVDVFDTWPTRDIGPAQRQREATVLLKMSELADLLSEVTR